MFLEVVIISMVWRFLGRNDVSLDLYFLGKNILRKKNVYIFGGRKKIGVFEMRWIREIMEKDKVEKLGKG